MSRTSGRRRGRGAWSLAAVAAAALTLGLTATTASAAVTLDWTTANVFSGPQATWLGYSTNPTPFPAGANGAVTTSGGATITDPDGAPVTTIDGGSPRGVDEEFTFSYPATGGSVDLGELEGEMDFEGVVSFVAPNPPAGHGFTITIDDPKIVLNGDGTGFLFASGLTTLGPPGSTPTPYTDGSAIWKLDLDGGTAPLPPNTAYPPAKWELNADGSQTLSGIVPMIETAGYVFPSPPYVAGTGPERTPSVFGTFSIRVAPNSGAPGPPGPAGAVGPAGPIGAAGPKGTEGKTITIVRRILVVRLAKAPFGKGAKRRVRVTRKGKLVGKGRVNGRRLRLKLEQGVGASKRLHGKYVLHVIGGKRRAVIEL